MIDYTDEDFEEEWDVEPIGSCDTCGVNVYDFDAWEHGGFLYCDQCEWSRRPR